MGEGRVLEVLGPSTGGIRRHVAALRDGLTARSWDIDVAGPPGVLDGLGGVDVALSLPSRRRPLRAPQSALALGSVARRYDLLHAHGLTAGWVASIPRRRPPLVVTVHNQVLEPVHGRMAPLLRPLEKDLPRHVDAVIATEASIADHLRGAGAPVLVVAPVGPAPVVRRRATEVRATLGVGGRDPLVVAVGRLDPQKSFATLLEAAALLQSAWPSLRVVIIGEGRSRRELEQRIRDLGLAGAVRLPGESANAADELAAADVVAMCSLWESGPLVVSEALRLGRPVVATPVGHVREVIEDGVSGRLVGIGDVRALAGAIGALLADPAGARRMGEEGHARVEKVLGSDVLLDGVEAVYRRVLHS